MKRILSDPKRYEAFGLLDSFLRNNNMSLGEQIVVDKITKSVKKQLIKYKENPIMIHGKRIESMFSYVAASLANCEIIKQEDAGDIFVKKENIKVPDYRVITSNGEQIFIEVKNCHDNLENGRAEFTQKYISSLMDYCKIFGSPLKIAIYWSKLSYWTLISADRLFNDSNKYYIDFINASKINELSALGDMLIATIPPLSIRIIADTNKEQPLDKTGNRTIEIKDIEIYSGKTKIYEKIERNIAFFMILFGDWTSISFPAHIEKGKLVYFDIRCLPPEIVKNQEFQMIGCLSGMIAKRYDFLTVSDVNKKIEKISPNVEPGSLGILIDKNYSGKYLKLWRFKVTPNYKS